MPSSPHKPHRPLAPDDDEVEPGRLPVDPGDGLLPPLVPHPSDPEPPADPEP